MIKIRIALVGKTKENWLETALEEYTKRLMPWAAIEWLWVKTDEQLLHLLEKESYCLGLDPQGRQFTSEGFSQFLQQKWEESGSRLTLVIGGPEGLPEILKKKLTLISLSKMTFTHQLTRLVLLEQIYRAFCIAKGIPYHK